MVLLLIFLQDMLSRSVYWFLFPALAGLLIGVRLQHEPVVELGRSTLLNLGLLLLQLLAITVYFSLKNRKWINITRHLLGLGDLLFLCCITFYLSVLNYLFFYITSLLFALLAWQLWRWLSSKKGLHIPLAGLQAFTLSLFLISDWCYGFFDLTNDTWLLHYMIK